MWHHKDRTKQSLHLEKKSISHKKLKGLLKSPRKEPVTVGIPLTLPFRGVVLILRNDHAGGKVKPDLCLVNDPDQSVTTEVGRDDLALVFQHV